MARKLENPKKLMNIGLSAIQAQEQAFAAVVMTALCTMLFSLVHWPCGTTCRTIRKETQS